MATVPKTRVGNEDIAAAGSSTDWSDFINKILKG